MKNWQNMIKWVSSNHQVSSSIKYQRKSCECVGLSCVTDCKAIASIQPVRWYSQAPDLKQIHLNCSIPLPCGTEGEKGLNHTLSTKTAAAMATDFCRWVFRALVILSCLMHSGVYEASGWGMLDPQNAAHFGSLDLVQHHHFKIHF